MRILNLDQEDINDETELGFIGYHGGPREDNGDEDQDPEGPEDGPSSDLEGK